MDDAEWELWREANALTQRGRAQLDSPCPDCLPAFATEMRALDRCDGEPGVSRILPTITLVGRGSRPGYATEADRRVALRQTWRECARRYRERVLQSASEAVQ